MITIGLIGCGYWGPNYIRILNEMRNVNLKWVCDLEQSKINILKERYPHIHITTQYTEILKDTEVDAVIISTPTSSHFTLARASLLADKHVLVEKPITNSSDDALELIRLSKEHKRILMVGHIFKLHAGINKVKEYMERNELGKVLYAYSSRTGLGPIRHDVNAAWDLSAHDISILLHIFGKYPQGVIAHGRAYIQENIEDIVFLILHFPDNVIANVHVSWLDPIKIRKLTLVGTKKMLVFDDISLTEKIKIFDKGVSYEKPFGTFGEFALQVRDGDIIIPKISMNEPLKEECLHFVKCITTLTRPITDGYDGYVVTKILEAAEESLKNNSTFVPITIKPMPDYDFS